MTWSFTTPFKPSKKTGIILALKEQMVAAGWVVVSSGDGTSYAAPGDPVPDLITTEAKLANARAWFRIQAPDGREYTWQKYNDSDGYSSNAQYRVKYSASAGFSGGSPSATQTPSATDEVVLVGSGSDASPTASPVMDNNANEGLWYVACGADDAAPYGVWTVAYATASSAYSRFHFIHEPVSGAHASDVDPTVILCSSYSWDNELMVAGLDTYPSYMHRAWIKKGLAGEGFVQVRASWNGFAGNGATDPYTSKDIEIPMLWVRDGGQAAPNGVVKGVGTVARWHMPRRGIGSTATVTTSRDRIIFGDISLPWDGSEPAA